MKLEGIVIITKGICLTVIPTFTALGAGLPQLGVTVLLGMPISAWQLLCSAIVAGAGGLLAFLSTSFSSYLSQRPTGSDTAPTVPTAATTTGKTT